MISFPAFAVEDEDLVKESREKIITKLQVLIKTVYIQQGLTNALSGCLGQEDFPADTCIKTKKENLDKLCRNFPRQAKLEMQGFSFSSPVQDIISFVFLVCCNLVRHVETLLT